jgi:hypothetical protein
MKQTPDHLASSSRDSDGDTDSDTDSTDNEWNIIPRLDDLANVSSLFGSVAAAGSPVGNSFRDVGSRPPSPMTREKLQAVLQEALDIINDDTDDTEVDFGQGDKP